MKSAEVMFGGGRQQPAVPLPSPVDPRSGDWGPPGDRSGWRKLKTGELPRDAGQPRGSLHRKGVTSPRSGAQGVP